MRLRLQFNWGLHCFVRGPMMGAPLSFASGGVVRKPAGEEGRGEQLSVWRTGEACNWAYLSSALECRFVDTCTIYWCVIEY
mmetsp:Transcript_43960/g.89776  ORF Transcript_43960/g.89776 Transcript_43960/m.89776 type:complete len:81 (+) Transcript_43960:149-391(+)